MPPLDLERDDESRPANSEDDENYLLPNPKLQPIYEKIGRSLDEILRLEVELIEEHTELDAMTWVSIYASRFREILNDDPSIQK